MAANPTALGGLTRFTISDISKCELPIDQIRVGGASATRALQSMDFFTLPGGPWHEEIMIIGELLRRNRTVTVTMENEKKAGDRVVKLLEEVKGRTIAKSTHGDARQAVSC